MKASISVNLAKRTRMMLVMCAALVAASALASGAHAAVRFSDGAYARSVYACKASTPNMFDTATYTNTRGIWVRARVFVHDANGRNINQWAAWTEFSEMSAGYSYSGQHINALADGGYTFQVQYARQVNGRWAYYSEYVPVFQYSDGWANMPVIIGAATLPRNTTCALGMTQIIIS